MNNTIALYESFMGKICDAYNCKEALPFLKKGFHAYCESVNAANSSKQIIDNFPTDLFNPKSFDYLDWLKEYGTEWKEDMIQFGHPSPSEQHAMIDEPARKWYERAIEHYRYYMALYSAYNKRYPGVFDGNTQINWKIPIIEIVTYSWPTGDAGVDDQQSLMVKENIGDFLRYAVNTELKSGNLV